MRNPLLVLMIVGMGAIGCGGVEDECETFCNWLDDCGLDADSDCADDCVEDYDDADEECQGAFDELAACVEEDDACTEEASECSGEAANFFEDCEDDF
jgi:hypothetical protein